MNSGQNDLLNSEVAVIGGLLLDNSQIAKVSGILISNDFSDPRYQALYEGIIELSQQGKNIDSLILSEHLKPLKIADIDEVDILELARHTPSAANVLAYAEVVKRNANKRRLISEFNNLIGCINDGGANIEESVLNSLRYIEQLCRPTSSKPKINIVGLHDFLGLEIAPRELIVGPWLPKQGLAMIYALPGIGKTHLGLNIAYAVTIGEINFLNWFIPKCRNVLYLDGEMSASDLQERLRSIEKSYDRKPSGTLKILTPDLQSEVLIDLSTHEGQSALQPHLEDIELIVVDNISTLCRTGKENEAEGWTSIQQWALKMKAEGRSVLFIHHAGKSGEQRGTSKRMDVLDTAIALKRPSSYEPSDGAAFEAHYEKTRGFYGDDAKPLLVRLNILADGRQQWTSDAIEESTYEKVINLSKEGRTQKEIANELGINKSTVSRHISTAKK